MQYVKVNAAQPKIMHQMIHEKEPRVIQEATEESVTVQMTPELFEAFTKFCVIVSCVSQKPGYAIMKECEKVLFDEFGKKPVIGYVIQQMAQDVYDKLVQK